MTSTPENDFPKTTRTPAFCRHGRPSQAENFDDPGDTKIVWLCAWGTSISGGAALIDAPPWVQRETLAGHMMRPGDCAGCAAWEKRDV
jgi:hypothetical protein